MAKKSFVAKFGKFAGLNTRIEANLLSPSEFQSSINVSTRSGAIVGIPDVGTSVASNSSHPNPRWLWLAGGGTWIWADQPQYALNDGNLSYTTRAGGAPQVYDSAGNSYQLGIQPLQNLTWSGGTGGTLNGTYSYAITFQTYDGLESNPQQFPLEFTFSSTGTNEITFGSSGDSIWPSDTRISAVRLWRTASDSLFHLLATVTSSGHTTIQDTGSVSDTTLLANKILTWNVAGAPGGAYSADHSPAPNLTRLPDRIHSIASGVASTGSGIVIGAVGSELRWSALGFPQYWPTTNSIPLDYPIESIIAYTDISVVFTTGGFYSLAGVDDTAMSLRRIDGFHFIMPGAGKSCLRTPLGTIYLAKEGHLAVFDGSTSRLVSQEKIADDYLSGLTIYGAAFVNDRYYLFHSQASDGSYSLIVDLHDGWEGAKYTTGSVEFLCSSQIDFDTPQVSYPHADLTNESNEPSGRRSFGFVSDTASKLFRLGGSYLDETAFNGETASSTSDYVLPGQGENWGSSGTMANAAQNPMCAYTYGGSGSAGDGYLAVYGGWNGSGQNYGTMFYNTQTATWTSNSNTINGQSSYAIIWGSACADTTLLDSSHFWVAGSYYTYTGSPSSTGVAGELLWQYTAGTSFTNGTWSNLGAPSASPTPPAAGMGAVYCPGSWFGDTSARIFIFGGSNSVQTSSSGDIQGVVNASGAMNVMYCCVISGPTWSSDANSEGTGISSAQLAGCSPRLFHGMVLDTTEKKIIIVGGQGSDGKALSDIWVFDPIAWVNAGSGSRISAWDNSAQIIVGFGDRYLHGASILGQTLYLAGGSSTENLFNTDLVSLELRAIYQTGSPAPYVAKPSDSGHIYPLEDGSPQQWTIQLADIEGDKPTAIKHATKARFEWQGQITVNSISDGGSAQAVGTYGNLSPRQTTETWLPFTGTGAARGRRISYNVVGAAGGNSTTQAKLWSFSADVQEELGTSA